MNHSCNGDFFKVTDVSLYRCLFDGQIVRLSEDAQTCPACKRLIKVARSHGERPVFVTELRQVSLTIASSNVITDEMFSTGDFSVTLPEDVITDFRRGPHSSLPPSVAEFLTTYDNYLQDCCCGRRTENSVVGGDPMVVEKAFRKVAADGFYDSPHMPPIEKNEECRWCKGHETRRKNKKTK